MILLIKKNFKYILLKSANENKFEFTMLDFSSSTARTSDENSILNRIQLI